MPHSPASAPLAPESASLERAIAALLAGGVLLVFSLAMAQDSATDVSPEKKPASTTAGAPGADDPAALPATAIAAATLPAAPPVEETAVHQSAAAKPVSFSTAAGRPTGAVPQQKEDRSAESKHHPARAEAESIPQPEAPQRSLQELIDSAPAPIVRWDTDLAREALQTAVLLDLYSDPHSATEVAEILEPASEAQQPAASHGQFAPARADRFHHLTGAIFSAQRDGRSPESFEPLFDDWLPNRPDLAGLPFLRDGACRLATAEAKSLSEASSRMSRIRQYRSQHSDQPHLADVLQKMLAASRLTASHMPGCYQVLQAEGEPLRKLLVDLLARHRTSEATEKLARLAVFDVSFKVRDKAVEELRGRDRELITSVIRTGLRYPWPPAADHAAEAIAALDLQSMRDELIELLDQPDPRAPVAAGPDSWKVRELVRVSHNRNCLLCHAPAIQATGMMFGAVPSPGDPLPTGTVYYASPNSVLVRADTTYLRQDFSLTHTVPNPEPWPAEQRYDYFVREREINAAEAADVQCRFPAGHSPQRQAVLYALRRLREQQAGNRQSDAI